MTEQISLNLTFEELEIIDKYIELNDDTRQLFDKIRSAYPESPVEAAYKRAYGWYPQTTPSVSNYEDNKDGFLSEERESNFPEKEDRPKTWILPVDDEGVVTLPEDLLERSGWKEGDTLVYEVCNGGVIVRKKEQMTEIEKLKGETLTDLIAQWSLDSVTDNIDLDVPTCVEYLVSRIEKWLPKEQSAAGSQNAYVECSVEGFNDAINKIRRKLR